METEQAEVAGESDPTTTDPLAREIAYYKAKVDELAGENLRLDYSISGLRHKLKQKQQGFALLSAMQQRLGSTQELAAVFRQVVALINGTLAMERSVVLIPSGEEHVYRPSSWLGIKDRDDPTLEAVRLRLPPGFAEGAAFFLVHKKVPVDEYTGPVAMAFGMPFFVAVPVVVQGAPVAVLVSGRTKEQKPLYPPLDEGDVDTFQAVAASLAALIGNQRVAVLQKMDELKTDFFANISHEFRTPITLTLGPIEAALNGRHGDVSDRMRSQLELMERNQRRLLTLVNQILDLAKLESGRMTLKLRRFVGLAEYCRRMIEGFAPLAAKRGLHHVVQIDEKTDEVELFLDVDLFDKVLVNLLSNAHKFTQAGSITLRTEVLRETRQLVIEVADSGLGIRADQLPHIFDRFRQADGTSSKEFSGTGIGLSLVKEAVELHGGDVRVMSEYGVGTTFRLFFRLGREHLPSDAVFLENESSDVPVETHRRAVVEVREGILAGRESHEENARTLAQWDASRDSVLYVDDNADLREYVGGTLRSAGYNVLVAIDGEDGLAMVRQHRPHLVLSDLMMPRMNGSQLCAALRADESIRETPFILLTAKSGTEARLDVLEKGADDFLNKPFSEPELLARIRNLIALRANERKVRDQLRAARDIQRALLPPSRVDLGGGIFVESMYEPCDDLSGDFFDVIPSGEWAYLYCADVTSHGTASAQVTYVVRGLFREHVSSQTGEALPELLKRLWHAYAKENLPYDVGLHVVRIHVPTGHVEAVRMNAPNSVLVEPDGRAQMLSFPAGSPFTSLRQEALPEFPVHTITLQPGQRLYLFTDGCYEFSRGPGRDFGLRRLTQALGPMPWESWQRALLDTLTAARDGPAFTDDLTVVRLSRI